VKAALLFVAGLAGCATPNPLVGAWVVDVARTHEEIQKIEPRLTATQRAILAKPAFFGDMSYVFDREQVLVIVHGACTGPMPYRYERLAGTKVRIVFEDSEGDTEETEIDLTAREIITPVGGGLEKEGVGQVFGLATYEAVARKYACVGEAKMAL